MIVFSKSSRAVRGIKVAVSVCLFLLSTTFSHAQGILEGETGQTNPKERSPQVTAIVPSRGAPPPPGLITPKDGAILTSGVVTFQWTKVDHVIGIGKYELYLNGSLKFGPIHPTDQTTDDYTLTLENNIYTLTVKPDKWLPDGNYTWKVRVVDINDNGMDSTTWRFTIDSTPPNILITEIDGKPTAISAADPSTIPSEPIIVTRRSPQLHGHTEASSEVQLAVTYPDGTIKRYKITAHLDGWFTFHLEGLPANQSVSLTFTAFDLAGNSRVLDGLKLMYKPRVVTIPIPPIFPEQVFLEISVVVPRFPQIPPLTSKNFPPPFEPLGELIGVEPEVPEETEILEVPVFHADPWLWGWLILFVGYIVSVFLLTRNRFTSFFVYLHGLLTFWLLGPGKKEHRWVDEKGRVLPFYAYAITWIDHVHKYHEKRAVSSPSGTWSVSKVLGNFYSLKNLHSVYTYPARSHHLSLSQGEVALEGQSLSFVDPASQTTLELRDQTYLVPSTYPVRFVAVAQSPSSKVRGWVFLTLIPRCILVIELVITLYILWYVKSWLTIGFLLMLLLMIVRDFQASLRERLLVYGEE